MNEIRSQRAKVNIVTTFINQLVSMLCGVVIPRIMIGAFGSTVYGATTSISQFLSYISLLEGGIGRVARGALYKPLAQNDNLAISKVYYTTKRFFRIVGMVFIIYVLVVAIVYYDIADITEFSRQFTFLLVIVISISGLAKYLGGLANLTLINADQKQYITNLIISITTVVNTILIVVLVNLECDVLIVKFVSSCIFVVRPVLYYWYVSINHFK